MGCSLISIRYSLVSVWFSLIFIRFEFGWEFRDMAVPGQYSCAAAGCEPDGAAARGGSQGGRRDAPGRRALRHRVREPEGQVARSGQGLMPPAEGHVDDGTECRIDVPNGKPGVVQQRAGNAYRPNL